MRGLLTAAVCFFASALTITAPADPYKTVQTQNGAITGHRAPDAKNVWEYLGIPYAQPPLGDLRFAAPKKYAGQGPYIAANYVSISLTRASIHVECLQRVRLINRLYAGIVCSSQRTK